MTWGLSSKQSKLPPQLSKNGIVQPKRENTESMWKDMMRFAVFLCLFGAVLSKQHRPTGNKPPRLQIATGSSSRLGIVAGSQLGLSSSTETALSLSEAEHLDMYLSYLPKQVSWSRKPESAIVLDCCKLVRSDRDPTVCPIDGRPRSRCKLSRTVEL